MTTHAVPTIGVECRDERHARGKVAIIGMFGLEKDGWAAWPFGPKNSRVRLSIGDDGRLVDEFDPRHGSDPLPRRHGYRLSCPLCGREALIRPGSDATGRLFVRFDELLKGDRRVVTLQQVEAWLTSS